MVIECPMLSPEEYWQFDRKIVDEVSNPVGESYPPEIFTNYFAIYSGLVQKFKPARVFEIGARYGYTAIVMWWAAAWASEQSQPFEYLGIDDESYPPAKGVTVGSCQKANDNFRVKGCHEFCRAVKWNSFHGIPAGFGTFDLIHIDGNHDVHGVLNDLDHCWPILNTGGVIVLDDYKMDPVREGIHQWLTRYSGDGEHDPVLAVQFIDDERGHCLIRKTGFTVGQLQADNSIALLFDKGSYPL